MEKPRIINRWLIRVSFNSLSASPNPCGGTTALKEGVRGMSVKTGSKREGGDWPPFPSRLFCSLRSRGDGRGWGFDPSFLIAWRYFG